ncbi:MAG: CRP-like cAMP-binding protein [Saprospiraceae bacterium]|jgi:CRP-like cAMP-binding protein
MLNKDNHKTILTHLKNKINLTDSEEATLATKLKHRMYLKGQYIVQGGDICRYQTFIISGKARTFYLDDNGNEHIIAFGIENWWVGDICSFTTQTPAEFNTQCLENTSVVQIPYDDMEQLYLDIPKLERYFRIIIQKAYGNMSKRIIRHHSLSAKERYILFNEASPEIVQRVPQYMIASYLGITKEFLSSIRKQIANEAKS